jgi:hypothetical protein
MHRVGQQFSARRDIAGQFVRYQGARRLPRASQQPLEKPSRGLLVSAGLQEDVEETAILVDGAPQILLLGVRLKPRLFDARLIGTGSDKLSLTGFERVERVLTASSMCNRGLSPGPTSSSRGPNSRSLQT